MQHVLESTKVVPEVIAFGPFRLFPAERVLEKAGEPIRLGSRAFDILSALLERPGEIVSQKELLAKVWRGLFVEEITVRVHIAALRKALNMDGEAASYLRTVPGRGYCLTASVTRKAIAAAERTPPPLAADYPLPPRLERMVGRDGTVGKIQEALKSSRFVTIVGAGGIGKTTVALTVAHAAIQEFRGAVCFVELGPLADRRLLAGAVASALGLSVQSDDPIPSIVARLRGKRILLVLDGAEHLIDAAAPLARRLFQELADVHLLVTSREALRVPGETVMQLPALGSPPDDPKMSADTARTFPAVQLFTQCMESSGVRPGQSDDEALLVAGMCRKLGGIALAIELAAAHVALQGIRGTAALLESQFSLRWPGRRTAPQRHQTLNATLDWSYGLLSEHERIVLQRLSVFAGSFTLEAAHAVSSDDGVGSEQVFVAVGRLCSKSLVSTDIAGESLRHRLLDTTRLYAASKLIDADEWRRLRRRHAVYYRDVLLGASSGEGGLAGQPLPHADLDNIRAALRWAFEVGGDEELGIDLAAFSAPLFLGKALFAECQVWTRKAAEKARTREAPTRQQLLCELATASALVLTQGLPGEVVSTWTKALDTATALQDTAGRLAAYLALWVQELRSPHLTKALALAEQCAAVTDALGDPGACAMSDWMLGLTKHYFGRHDEARMHFQRSLDEDIESARLTQVKQIGFDRRTDCLGLMSNLALMQGRPEEARRWEEQAMLEAQKLNLAMPNCIALTWAAFNAFLSQPDLDTVEREVVDLLDHCRSHGISVYAGLGLALLGLCQIRRADFDGGMPLVNEGLRELAAGDYEVFHPIIRACLCEALLDSGQTGAATDLMATLEASERSPMHWCKPEVLRVKGKLVSQCIDRDSGAIILQSSISMARELGAVFWELRTALTICESWDAEKRRSDARALLRPIVDHFEDEPTTIDLLAARKLIGRV
ncbi:MAG: winged helix-turn-helix domain-containing protein [Rhizomicrobium sp.]